MWLFAALCFTPLYITAILIYKDTKKAKRVKYGEEVIKKVLENV